MNFKKLELEDMETIQPFFTMQFTRMCDHSAGTVMMWRNSFNTEFATHEGALFFRVQYGKTKERAYTIPFAMDKKPAIAALKEYIETNNEPVFFTTIAKDCLPCLQEVFGELEVSSDRDTFDYLYNASDLASFRGRKFNGQRNHTNRFKKLYPNYEFVEIDAENVSFVLEFFKDFIKDNPKDVSSAKEEAEHVIEVLENFELFAFVGGYIAVEGEIVAFSLGEKINDTLFVHIEKARREFSGSYQMMVNEFAKHFSSPEILYINREDDMGDEGLRKSKLSYQPIELIEKFIAKKPIKAGR